MALSLSLSRGAIRLAGALSRRSRRTFAFNAAELMEASVEQLRRLPRLPGAFTVRRAVPEDQPALCTFARDPLRIARLLSSGDLGLIAVSGDRVLAMEWIRFGPADYEWDAHRLGLVFNVPSGSCWLHNGMGLSRGPWAMVLGRLPYALEERGVEAAHLWVASDNLYSKQCHESFGFRRIGRIVAFRVRERRPFVWLAMEGKKSVRMHGGTINLPGQELSQ